MDPQNAFARQYVFHSLKVEKKLQLTKTSFALQFEIPENLEENYNFIAGQYVGIRFMYEDDEITNDYSITSSPAEGKLCVAVRYHEEGGSSFFLNTIAQAGSHLDVSQPKGRFTLISKPDEFRTIICFAAGIGITPIFSQIKNLLYTEKRTRIFLFYGNRTPEETVFKKELEELALSSGGRFQVFHFYSENKSGGFFSGRIDKHKVKLIINQILNFDDTDEESTIWDAVDEVLICGSGMFIKEIANVCFEHGIPKRNIHYELFDEFNEDIYPLEVSLPLIQPVYINYKFNGSNYRAELKNNSQKILQSLLQFGFPVPFSCKSGICGSCICTLEKGDVEQLENEYLTDSEQKAGKILPCMSYALERNLILDFDR